MKYYKLFINPIETHKETSKENHTIYLPQEDIYELKDGESVEELIKYVSTPEQVEDTYVTFEVKSEEVSVDEYIDYMEKKIKDYCFNKIKMKQMENKTINEYKEWNKKLNSEEKKKLYAQTLGPTFIMIRSRFITSRIFDLDKMPVRVYFELLDKLANTPFQDGKKMMDEYIEKYGRKE